MCIWKTSIWSSVAPARISLEQSSRNRPVVSFLLTVETSFAYVLVRQSTVTTAICINLQSTCIHTWTLTLKYFSVFVDITYILGTAWKPSLLAWKVGERGKDTWIRNTSRHGTLNSTQRNNGARSERGIQYGP